MALMNTVDTDPRDASHIGSHTSEFYRDFLRKSPWPQ